MGATKQEQLNRMEYEVSTEDIYEDETGNNILVVNCDDFAGDSTHTVVFHCANKGAAERILGAISWKDLIGFTVEVNGDLANRLAQAHAEAKED